MSELENSSTDEVAYEGAVQPYMFEPMAEVLPDVEGLHECLTRRLSVDRHHGDVFLYSLMLYTLP